MIELLPLVGLDSCVIIEAAKVPHGLCRIIVDLARNGVFRVLLVPRVDFEVRRELENEGLLDWYEEWLAEVTVYLCDRPTCREVRNAVPYLWPKITHCPDFRVAVSIRHYSPRYFITSNTKDRKDWNGTPELRAALGGTSVVVPKRYLTDMKLAIPSRFKAAQVGGSVR